MNRKTFIVVIVSLGLGFLLFFCYGIKEKKKAVNNAQQLLSEVYEINDGYGYKIMVDTKVLIQQDFIPAITNNIPFHTKLDAYIIAELIIQRLKMGQDPKIVKQDLIDFGIATKHLNQKL